CLVGTRKKILHQLESWTQASDPKLFWLYGQAGTGKSAISQSMFNQLKEENAPCAFYTCSKTQAELHKALNVLPTLCFQLCAISKSYAEWIVGQINNDPSFKDSLGHISTQVDVLFVKPILQVDHSLKGVVVILDALDEC
ncbi:hypothetical protein BDN72DRAFT_741050, partial [Pluteus cervinus]